MTLCIVWFFTLRSYRRLNAAKYTVILKLEQELDAQPFCDEWEELKKKVPIGAPPLGSLRGRWVKLKDQYTELTNIESVVPIVFGLVYIALIVRAFT